MKNSNICKSGHSDHSLASKLLADRGFSTFASSIGLSEFVHTRAYKYSSNVHATRVNTHSSHVCVCRLLRRLLLASSRREAARDFACELESCGSGALLSAVCEGTAATAVCIIGQQNGGSAPLTHTHTHTCSEKKKNTPGKVHSCN